MLKDPATKYKPTATARSVGLKNRTWVDNTLTRAPIWLSTDLRDGNQALFEPMDKARKLRLFEAIVATGIKEIEIGFPSASQIDFDVARTLIMQNLIPDDVTIMALSQARANLLPRTVEALAGAKQAIVHIYNATAPVWREVVFKHSVTTMLKMIREQIRLVRKLITKHPETDWRLEYSPEAFSSTEMPIALKACLEACRAWGMYEDPDKRIIINLPTTVENATPNVFADQVEWMIRGFTEAGLRDRITVSVHTHNDRGTGVAAAEFAMMAGADRVEGCLFGNGERSGNVDLVTIALNLYTHGIAPKLNVADINVVARIVEDCTQIPIHPRHPYVGDLVYTSFSGSHQDAIKKGFAVQPQCAYWQVPYLPIDPADLGRNYDSVIRINSQSGKGGIAFLLEKTYGVVMPRRMQVEFSTAVQEASENVGSEIAAKDLWSIFSDTYLTLSTPLLYKSHHIVASDADSDIQRITLNVVYNSKEVTLEACGNGPIDAAVGALSQLTDLTLRVDYYEERAIGSGANAEALAIIEMASEKLAPCFGVGCHANISTAAILAAISATNRLLNR